MNQSEISERAVREIQSSCLGIDDEMGIVIFEAEKAKAIVERAIAESQVWISVEEKLPEMGQTVLVYFANLGLNAYIDVWPYDNMNQYFRKGKASLSPNEDVTHWMPLPEPPKGNENV